jgi:hypothetical protein
MSAARPRTISLVHTQFPVFLGRHIHNILIAPIDSDKVPDVVLTSIDGDTLTHVWYKNNGRLLFSRVPTKNVIGACGTNEEPVSLAAGDLERDNDVDIFVACRSNTSGTPAALKVYRNVDGAFDSQTLGSIADMSKVEVMDLTGDNYDDIIITYTVAGMTNILSKANNMSGGFLNWTTLLSAPSCGASFGDTDNDGDIDMVAWTKDNSNFTMLIFRENLGNGTFAPATDLKKPREISFVARFDVNGDTRKDIVALNAATGKLYWYQQVACFGSFPSPAPSASSNRPSRSPVPTPTAATAAPCSSAPYGVSPVDMDNDGLMDIVLVESGQISLLKNDGAFNYARYRFKELGTK